MSKNLGILSADLFSIKKMKAEHNAEIKKLNAEQRRVEAELLEAMQEQKLVKLSDDHGTVYITRQVVPKVLDWDAFHEYIRETNYFHMLERRPSRLAYRESYEQGQAVPGVDAVVFDEVRTRKT